MQALGLSIEGVVELTYSLSEHGLMPAAIRSYVAAMSDRIISLNMQQVSHFNILSVMCFSSCKSFYMTHLQLT